MQKKIVSMAINCIGRPKEYRTYNEVIEMYWKLRKAANSS